MSLLSGPLVATTLPIQPAFSDALNYLLAGFGIVMMTLLALAIVCTLVGFFFKSFPGLAGPAKESVKPAVAGQALGGGIDTNTVAVIGTAIDQALGGRYRIKSVTPLGKK